MYNYFSCLSKYKENSWKNTVIGIKLSITFVFPLLYLILCDYNGWSAGPSHLKQGISDETRSDQSLFIVLVSAILILSIIFIAAACAIRIWNRDIFSNIISERFTYLHNRYLISKYTKICWFLFDYFNNIT